VVHWDNSSSGYGDRGLQIPVALIRRVNIVTIVITIAITTTTTTTSRTGGYQMPSFGIVIAEWIVTKTATTTTTCRHYYTVTVNLIKDRKRRQQQQRRQRLLTQKQKQKQNENGEKNYLGSVERRRHYGSLACNQY